MRPLLVFEIAVAYGVGSFTLTLKMSELPKVGPQSCCGAGRATVVPLRRDIRHASMAGQCAAFRASFQTAAPYEFVATA